MRPALHVVPPRRDDREPGVRTCGRRSVLFLCDDPTDVDAFDPIARLLTDCDVSFAPGDRPADGTWLARLGLARTGASSLRVVERCAERGLALDLRRVPLDHELAVRAVRDERQARRVDHLCVLGQGLRSRLQAMGVEAHRISVTGSPAADDRELRMRAADNVAAVCRVLLQRPAAFRELRCWREVGVLRADW